MDADRRGRAAGSDANRDGRPGRAATDREAVLAGAVFGTVITILLPMVYVVAGAALQAGRAGPSAPGGMLGDGAVLLAMVGAIAMAAIYVVGVPLALQVERRLATRGAVRWLVYGLAGAGGGVAIGTIFAGPSEGLLIFVPFGLVAALGGAGGVAWARRRPARVVRRVGPGSTGGLVAITLVAWLATGAVFIPLLVASVAGALSLTLCLLTERDTSTASWS